MNIRTINPIITLQFHKNIIIIFLRFTFNRGKHFGRSSSLDLRNLVSFGPVYICFITLHAILSIPLVPFNHSQSGKSSVGFVLSPLARWYVLLPNSLLAELVYMCVYTCLFSWQKALRKADKVREIEWTMLVMRDRSSRRWWISLLDKRCTRGLLVSWGDSINKPWLRCHVPPMSKLTVFSSFD